MQNLFAQQVVTLGPLCALYRLGQVGYKAEQVEVTLPSQSLEVGREDVTGSNLILGHGGARNDLPEEGAFTGDWKKLMLAPITCASSNVKEGGNVPCRRNGTEGEKMHFVRETKVQYDSDRKSEE